MWKKLQNLQNVHIKNITKIFLKFWIKYKVEKSFLTPLIYVF